jgi:hypothetical protein
MCTKIRVGGRNCPLVKRQPHKRLELQLKLSGILSRTSLLLSATWHSMRSMHNGAPNALPFWKLQYAQMREGFGEGTAPTESCQARRMSRSSLA